MADIRLDPAIQLPKDSKRGETAETSEESAKKLRMQHGAPPFKGDVRGVDASTGPRDDSLSVFLNKSTAAHPANSPQFHAIADKSVSSRVMELENRGHTFTSSPSAKQVEKRLGLPEGHCLRLDDIAQWLLTAEARPCCERLMAHMLTHGGDPNASLDPPPAVPSDRLAAKLMRYFVNRRWDGQLRDHLSEQEVSALMPQAVVTSLVDACDEGGRLALGDVALTFGETGETLACELSTALGHGANAVSANRPFAKFRHTPQAVAKIVARSMRSHHVADRMTGFLRVADDLVGPDAFEGCRVIKRGHLNETTGVQLNALLAAGAEPSGLLTKSYSVNMNVVYQAADRGWKLEPLSLERPEVDFEDSLMYPIMALLSRAANVAPDTTLIVLDEGFIVCEMIHALRESGRDLSPNLKYLVAVEGTEKGKHRYGELLKEGFKLEFPVWDMAGSWLKKRVVSPCIGESIVFQIEHDLWECHPDLRIDPKEASVFGYGAVGKETADRLRERGYAVHVFDSDPEAMGRAADDGYETGAFCNGDDPATLEAARDRILPHSHLLIACTPGPCLTDKQRMLLPNKAVLANAGSGYETLGIPVVSTDAVPGEKPTEGWMQRMLRDRSGESLGDEGPLAMPGLLDYRDYPGIGDLKADDSERIDGRGMRHSTFGGLDLCTGDALARDRNFHRVLRGPNGEEHLVLRNSGVINLRFDLPPEYAQTIRSLELVAAKLAADMPDAEPGWHDIPDSVQKRIYQILSDDLEAKGLSLLHPDLRKTPPRGAEAFIRAMKQRGEPGYD